MNNYNDIINIKHFEPRHKRMSIYERSAQFAPFAALTGYSDQIKETSRITEKKIYIGEDYKKIINEKLEILQRHISENPEVRVIYFVHDNSKKGGKYNEYIGNLDKISINEQNLIFTDKNVININNIKDIDSNIIVDY